MRMPTKTIDDGNHNNGRYWRLAYGTVHRKLGPAVELDSGHKEWWIRGKCYAWQPSVILPPHTPYTYMGARSDLTQFGYGKDDI